jgi:hypothetical protein
MLRFFVFALFTTITIDVLWLDPCFAQSTPTPPSNIPPSPVNLPDTVLNQAYMWTFRTGTSDNARALAFRIDNTSGFDLQGILCMYNQGNVGGDVSFIRQQTRFEKNGQSVVNYTIPCTLKKLPNSDSVFDIETQTNLGVRLTIGRLTKSLSGKIIFIRWDKDTTITLNNNPVPHDPCDQPPDIGEEELVATANDLTPTPTATLSLNPPQRVAQSTPDLP